jgi:hypothetical protein
VLRVVIPAQPAHVEGMETRRAGPYAASFPNFRPLFREWQDQLEGTLQVCLGFAGVIAMLELAVQARPVDGWEVQTHTEIVQWLRAHAQWYFGSTSLWAGLPRVGTMVMGLTALGTLFVVILLARRRFYSASLIAITGFGTYAVVRALQIALPQQSLHLGHGVQATGSFPSLYAAVGTGVIATLAIMLGRISPGPFRFAIFLVGAFAAVDIVVSGLALEMIPEVIAGVATALALMSLLHPLAEVVLDHEDQVCAQRPPLFDLSFLQPPPAPSWLQNHWDSIGRSVIMHREGRAILRQARAEAQIAEREALADDRAAKKVIRAELRTAKVEARRAEADARAAVRHDEARRKAEAKAARERIRIENRAAAARAKTETTAAEAERRREELENGAERARIQEEERVRLDNLKAEDREAEAAARSDKKRRLEEERTRLRNEEAERRKLAAADKADAKLARQSEREQKEADKRERRRLDSEAKLETERARIAELARQKAETEARRQAEALARTERQNAEQCERERTRAEEQERLRADSHVAAEARLEAEREAERLRTEAQAARRAEAQARADAKVAAEQERTRLKAGEADRLRAEEATAEERKRAEAQARADAKRNQKMMRDSERAEKTAASRAEKRAHEKVERVSIAEPAPAPLPEPKKPSVVPSKPDRARAGHMPGLPFKKQPQQPSPVEMARMASRIASYTQRPAPKGDGVSPSGGPTT